MIRQRHGDANRLGFAVQRCLLWCLGQGGLTTTDVPPALLQWTPRNGASIRRAGPSV
ncbi:Transposase (plasmid) [Mycetohabitans rhizoxinica HKI 454]|uniref:Transposase n=1 Tax=Mycetohabitans rhizoxinica (strain DSM 19002 / CIP 109453 / HKI 454) TaxID=882378 RepID=E5AV26_MYCRK|nr:Transposase [Mycetohabitans rhizoxinica HKI 454]